MSKRCAARRETQQTGSAQKLKQAGTTYWAGVLLLLLLGGSQVLLPMASQPA